MAAANDRSISEFPSASELLAGDYFIVSEPDENAQNGYQTLKLEGTDLAEGIVSGLQFPLLLNTTAQTIVGAINEVNGVWLTGTLTIGSTTLTLSDASITTSSKVDVYTDTYGVSPENVVVTTGSVTLTFEAQEAALGVMVKIS